MAKFKRPPILFIMLIIAFLLVICRSYMVETFIDAPIPEFCGQLGFKMDKYQAFFSFRDDYETTRYYTMEQCKKLGGKMYPHTMHCVKLGNKKKVQTDYSVLCGGLNKKVTSAPEECGTYGTPFMATKKLKVNPPGCKSELCDKDISVMNKHLRSYTAEECKALKGHFRDTGIGLGECTDSGFMPYSISCASLNSSVLPSMSSIKDAGSSLFSKKDSSESGDAESDRTWWAYFFGESKQDDSTKEDKESPTKV